VSTSSAPAFAVGSHVSEWRDEIIYQVIIDRFADGDTSNDYRIEPGTPARYHGGDWRGLTQHLDYVRALGVTTLWISPIVKNVETDAGIDSYHGYWTQDPFSLNAHFGNLDDLRDLTTQAHALGMKVVLDLVCNHMGQLFFYDINKNGVPDESVSGGIDTQGQAIHITEYDPDYQDPFVMSFTAEGPSGPAPIIFFQDALDNKVPPPDPRLANFLNYHRHGRIVDYNDPVPPGVPDGREQTLNGDFPGGLKDLATENQDVQDAMFEAYSKWIGAADFDGFRIDTVKHVNHDFWQNFNPRIRTYAASIGKDKFFQFGESFDGDDVLDGSYTMNGELDALFDFPQYYNVMLGVFVNSGATTQVQARWQSLQANWSTSPSGVGVPSTQLHVNFLDNHDVGRFLWQLAQVNRTDAIAALHNAIVFQMTEDGIPCVYYGTEQEFSGGNDPANREDLWPTNYATDGDTFQWIAKLTGLRRQLEALRRGTMNFVWTSTHVAMEDDAGMLAFERIVAADGAYALIIQNTSPNHAGVPAFGGVTLKTSPGAFGAVLTDALGSGVTVTVGADGTVTLPAPMLPTTSLILVPTGP
jgi:glycosidase